MFRVVTTVEGLERPTRLVTLKGPLGNYVSVRARNVDNLEKLRLGDTIVVTYTEALAISLEKAPPNHGKDNALPTGSRSEQPKSAASNWRPGSGQEFNCCLRPIALSA